MKVDPVCQSSHPYEKPDLEYTITNRKAPLAKDSNIKKETNTTNSIMNERYTYRVNILENSFQCGCLWWWWWWWCFEAEGVFNNTDQI